MKVVVIFGGQILIQICNEGMVVVLKVVTKVVMIFSGQILIQIYKLGDGCVE